MNVFRKASLVVLVAFVAVLALGLFQSSAEAGGHNHHGHHFHHGHHNYGHFVKYPSYNYWPTYQYLKPVSYPVTYYDCYGRPYIVWQTSYSNYTNPIW